MSVNPHQHDGVTQPVYLSPSEGTTTNHLDDPYDPTTTIDPYLVPLHPGSPSKESRRTLSLSFFTSQRKSWSYILFCVLMGTLYVVPLKVLYDAEEMPKEIPGPIKQISLIGERNSGTRWLYEHLGLCFNHTIPIRRRLGRYKHWFQHENRDMYVNGTLVIAQFRNVYEWTEAMRKVPHHASAHIDLPWKEFVTKPWTMERVGADLTQKYLSNRTLCQENFTYNEVVSCAYEPLGHAWNNGKPRFSEHQPIYELRTDGSGLPYDSILDFRAAKIRNFLDTQHYWGVFDTWSVQYEYLLNRGTTALIRKLENVTNVTAMCDPSPPQKNRTRRRLDMGLVHYLRQHVDWKTEKLIGYRE